ncbi:MAG: glycine--tRNA ligase [Promethearchaeota archaeon]|nr:MAG: glycine--tRNA ligase [Candidatus Lokiarchaeota archaeon]
MKDYDKITSLFKRKGYVWGPSPEIYEGGLAGFYDLGPLGAMLWNNIANTIRASYFEEGFYEITAPLIMPRKVWEASGHLGGFTDPLTKCSKCGAVFRVDKLIKELHPKEEVDGLTYEEFDKKIEDLKIKCLSCKGPLTKTMPQNMMLRTTIGLDTEAYLRPETATATYLPFKRYYEFFRSKLPFGVFQLGPAFRNEISPRQGLLRKREFSQAEAQLFIFKGDKDKWEKWNDYKNNELNLYSYKAQSKGAGPKKVKLADAIKNKLLQNKAYATCLGIAYKIALDMGLDPKRLRLRQHFPNERAFYALDAWDLEWNSDCFGWTEICGIHDRSDYDLTQHGKYSGQDLSVNNNGKKEIPHILEIAFGIERLLYVTLEQAYEEEKERTVLRLPPMLAPIEVKIYPLLSKDGLPDKAKEVYELMLDEGLFAEYDETGSIGRRYRRADEEGVPFCITIDHQTIKDETVTVRDRDSMKQLRIKISDLEDFVKQALEGDIDL